MGCSGRTVKQMGPPHLGHKDSRRLRAHRGAQERKERLEIAAEEARALPAERRSVLDSADTIAAFAKEMSESLKTRELTGTRAFIQSFVKEIEVRAGILYSLPTLEDSPIGGADAAEVALSGRVMSTVHSGCPASSLAGGGNLPRVTVSFLAMSNSGVARNPCRPPNLAGRCRCFR